MIDSLAYLVVQTPHLSEWIDVAASHIGFQVDVFRPGEAVRLRMDDRAQRFVLRATTELPSLALGFAVRDAQVLEALRVKLGKAGYVCTPGTADDIELRSVEALFSFLDPDGNRVEIVHGLRAAATPFSPGRPLGGFRTGDLGMGHVALVAAHYGPMAHLYKELLGFQLSDYVKTPFNAEFLHVNPRHHTLALIDIGGPPAIHHVMVEYRDFDDVGRAYDIAQGRPESVSVTLGRHSNDHVTSFYLKTPDGWMLELGWAGRIVGADWQVEELTGGPSLWGHDRRWLPDAKRQEARQLLRDVAAKGIRAPVAAQSQAATEAGTTEERHTS